MVTCGRPAFANMLPLAPLNPFIVGLPPTMAAAAAAAAAAAVAASTGATTAASSTPAIISTATSPVAASLAGAGTTTTTTTTVIRPKLAFSIDAIVGGHMRCDGGTGEAPPAAPTRPLRPSVVMSPAMAAARRSMTPEIIVDATQGYTERFSRSPPPRDGGDDFHRPPLCEPAELRTGAHAGGATYRPLPRELAAFGAPRGFIYCRRKSSLDRCSPSPEREADGGSPPPAGRCRSRSPLPLHQLAEHQQQHHLLRRFEGGSRSPTPTPPRGAGSPLPLPLPAPHVPLPLEAANRLGPAMALPPSLIRPLALPAALPNLALMPAQRPGSNGGLRQSPPPPAPPTSGSATSTSAPPLNSLPPTARIPPPPPHGVMSGGPPPPHFIAAQFQMAAALAHHHHQQQQQQQHHHQQQQQHQHPSHPGAPPPPHLPPGHPMALFPPGPPHHPAFGAPPHLIRDTYPLYPWLLSRHGRIFPHRFPGGFLLQPFRKPKRVRTAFSPTQLLKLEHAFEGNHYVVGAERKQLAQGLSLTETQVKVWFQNRRTKHKRMQQEGDEADGKSHKENSTGGDSESKNESSQNSFEDQDEDEEIGADGELVEDGCEEIEDEEDDVDDEDEVIDMDDFGSDMDAEEQQRLRAQFHQQLQQHQQQIGAAASAQGSQMASQEQQRQQQQLQHQQFIQQQFYLHHQQLQQQQLKQPQQP